MATRQTTKMASGPRAKPASKQSAAKQPAAKKPAAKKAPAPWDRDNPKSPPERQHLTPQAKATAKRHAKAAGRPYPNLMDNMQAAVASQQAAPGATVGQKVAHKKVALKTAARKKATPQRRTA